ncbi:succinylglutamate desuccinylase/aspartoacylase family protein [Thermopetrobacter sp. TC1]|uniref:succinylglutamate desuccinylase/aspartoacylase domain-containing protein n=1 Tax=Thermopetrobacter sp. TC1 TaxID=1495045 RepID=UPI00057064A1|nr:succinylglutamate desuccinylase/aspartoacylase family protein [Thermopetrobacter sp. TC1]
MPCEVHTPVPSTPGNALQLAVCRFGRAGARPKAYIQAAMHADEVPAMLVAAHLRALLEKADTDGRISGEIILVPQANPLGGAQELLGHHLGRYHLPSGRNFNRHWPDASAAVCARRETFGDDPAANVLRVRDIVREWLAAFTPKQPDEYLKHFLMTLAHDADVVLDLHTDAEALLHLYVDKDRWPDLAPLAALLDAQVVMLCRDSGGNAFEETVAAPYIALREAGVAVDLPDTVTVELRGAQDVSDDLAARDAAALYAWLVHRGVIAAAENDPHARSIPTFTGLAAPFAATEPVRAPVGGLVIFTRPLSAMIETGETIAEILDPQTGMRTPAPAQTSGLLFTRTLHKWVQPGAVIAKIQGKTPLPDRTPGQMMTD